MPVHLFLSPSGVALPRWLEAFPGAVCQRPEDALQAGNRVVMVWLKLSDEQPADRQIFAARQMIGDSPFVVLSSATSEDEAMKCFAASARGYGNAHASPDHLRQMADVVLRGGIWVGEGLMQKMLAALSSRISPPKAAVSLDALTEREVSVAKAVAQGGSNKEIARELGVTERTVKAHVSSILEKLKVRDRLQLALRLSGRDVA